MTTKLEILRALKARGVDIEWYHLRDAREGYVDVFLREDDRVRAGQAFRLINPWMGYDYNQQRIVRRINAQEVD